MKRSRDDGFMSSQLKRPATSPPVEPSGQAQMSTASSTQRLTTTDALSYLKNVKENFQDKQDKYNEFLDVMKDFKAQRIDTSGVIYRVKELFKGNRDLILGFNTFLPKGFEITLPPEDKFLKKPVEFKEAMTFVNKIKARFQGDDRVYKAFLDIFNMYRRENKSISEVYQEVEVLFHGHSDLLVEFNHFLPRTSGTASVQYSPPGRNTTRRGDDRGSPMTTTRPMHVEKKPAVSYPVDDHAIHHTVEQLNQAKKVTEKRGDVDKNEWEHADESDHKQNSANQDESGADQFQRGMQDPESSFLEKVKEQIQDPENCKKIYDCICSYKSKFVAAAQFRNLVTILLGTHPDLMEACESFITHTEKIGSFRSSKHIVRSLKPEGEGVDHDRVDTDRNRDRDNGERDRHDRGLAYNTRDAMGQKVSLYASRDKFTMKPIQDLDLSNCENCTPSYRLLPEHFPIPTASFKTEIGAEVLNDRWVSVTSGSEDYSFKHMRKNQYEESLFRCEDDRFELDMLLESVNTTAKRVEELLNTLNCHENIAESSFCVEDHLTALNLRCIERLYGDHGLDIMDALRKNALVSLPIILIRLKQKQVEWAQCRADFNKVWAEIYAKNYQKSLDHRSFYFKQQDAKNLSATELLAEIKEISKKHKNEDIVVGSGYAQPIRPHMEFEYPDPGIQEDLYQLMKYSCAEICTPEQRDKVLKIWTNFLEPLLGIPSHPLSAEDKKDASEVDHRVSQSLENNSRETGNPADNVADSKPSDMVKKGEEHGPLGHSCLMGNGNSEVNHDHYPGADNIASKIDALCNNPQNGLKQTDAGMMFAGEMNANEENDSATHKGFDTANVDCGLDAIPTHESQPEVAGAQSCHDQSEAPSNIEGDADELFPERNGKYEKSDTKEEETPSKSRSAGGDTWVVAEDDTDANADDGEESAHGSSDSENASENGDVSASKSASGEECEPDEDGDEDENDNKAESEGEADGLAEDVPDAEGTVPYSDNFLLSSKPLNVKKFPMPLHGNNHNSQIFYGNDSFYLLLRLHGILYERMRSAKHHSLSPENKRRSLNDANLDGPYARFKDALNNLLNGSSDNAKFEDECRAIIGAQSYVLFTLDKLIHTLVKQLQTIATEDLEDELLQLYAYENSRNPKYFSDAIYHANACGVLPDNNLYRFECQPCPTRLTIQLMRNEPGTLVPMSVFMDPRFAAYLNDELFTCVPERKGKLKPRSQIFLKRNRLNFSTGDESSNFCNATEGLIVENDMEIRINSTTTKATYVLEMEDFLYRARNARNKRKTRNGEETSNGCPRRNKRTEEMCKSQPQQNCSQ